MQTVVNPKWYKDIRHYADSIKISTEEANGFIRCVEAGGNGSKSNRVWRNNSSPFDTKIDLNGNSDNILNLQYSDSTDRKSDCGGYAIEPSDSVVKQSSRFLKLGRVGL